MVGPILFLSIFTLEGWLRPGYASMRMYVSELSNGPHGWIQIANFILLGLLFLAFKYGVAAEFKDGKASKAGPMLLAIIGASFLLSGPFITDPATIFLQMSWHGMLHGIFGAIVFSLAPVSCFVFFRRFREDQKWQLLQWWTLAVGVLLVALVILLKMAQLPTALRQWAGLIQRMTLITYLGWIFAFARVLYERSRQG